MNKTRTLNALLVAIFTLSFFNLSIPNVLAASASLYFAPSSGTHAVGSTFSVAVKVSSPEQAINASQGAITYDSTRLDVVGVNKAGSVFSLWTTEPSAGGGVINFGGGIPHPGYTGSAGGVFNITFKAKSTGDATVRFSSGAVLANDGKGTNIMSGMGSAKYTISGQTTQPKPSPSTPSTPSTPEPSALYNNPEVKSETHPDQNEWYKENNVSLLWDMPGAVSGASIGFDQEPSSDPGPASDGILSDKEYSLVEDGVWYFHLKLKDDKRWGSPTHYRIMIDTVAPHPFEVTVDPIEPGQWPTIRFETTDDGSGIDRYEVLIGSLTDQAHIVESDVGELQTSDLEVGNHVALVKAIDKAGNETVSTVSFQIDAIDAPIITSYPTEMNSSDLLYIGGTSIPDSSVIVYIDVKGVLLENTTKSDSEGNWFYVAKDKLSNGRYSAWSIAVNSNGIKSNPSQKISFLVSPPIFAVVGNFVISYFTLLVSMLFLVVLIIAVIFWIILMVRKKLKKETIEVEDVLKRNLDILKSEIDKEITAIKKPTTVAGLAKDKAKAREKINANIYTAQEKILKEIKDVEEILK